MMNVLSKEFEPIKITDKVRAFNENKVFTGDVRMSEGMYRTDDEKEKYISDSLKRPLP